MHVPSPAEYRRHLRRGEQACPACKAEWRAKARERKAAARRARMGEE